MEISSTTSSRFEELSLLHKNRGGDEALVRKKLVKVWTRILEKYARPEAFIPHDEALRKELFEVGVEAALDALVSEHWYIFGFMIRGEIESKIGSELARFNLHDFVEDVKVAQNDPEMLVHLREKIRHYVIEGSS